MGEHDRAYGDRGFVGTWLGRIAVVWLLASVFVMIGLTAFVFIGSRRRSSGGRRYLVFSDDAVVPLPHGRGYPDDVIDLSEPDHAEPAVTHPVTSASGSLDRLLAGVTMPCGLERLPLDEVEEEYRRAYMTSGWDPKTVAVMMVDELERLGMDVEPLSYTEARAHRDGLELAVTLYLEPRRVIRGRGPAFPGAQPDSVVIEFSVA